MQAREVTEKIRGRAYAIYMARGGAPGSEVSDWLQAEEEIVAARESLLDESSEESFPASDPPAL